MESGTLRLLSCFIACSNRPVMEWPNSLLLWMACVMHWEGYSDTQRPQRTTQWHLQLLAEPHTALCVMCGFMKSKGVSSLHIPEPSSLSCQGLSRPLYFWAGFLFRALVGKDPLTKALIKRRCAKRLPQMNYSPSKSKCVRVNRKVFILQQSDYQLRILGVRLCFHIHWQSMKMILNTTETYKGCKSSLEYDCHLKEKRREVLRSEISSFPPSIMNEKCFPKYHSI